MPSATHYLRVTAPRVEALEPSQQLLPSLAPTAGRQARRPQWCILQLPGLASRRRGRAWLER